MITLLLTILAPLLALCWLADAVDQRKDRKP